VQAAAVVVVTVLLLVVLQLQVVAQVAVLVEQFFHKAEQQILVVAVEVLKVEMVMLAVLVVQV
jgi:hypothetical protein